jgi:hypothetical protein
VRLCTWEEVAGDATARSSEALLDATRSTWANSERNTIEVSEKSSGVKSIPARTAAMWNPLPVSGAGQAGHEDIGPARTEWL